MLPSLTLLLAVLSPVQGAPVGGRPDLHGTVVNPSGQPIEGAMVFIYTAEPRRGTGSI